MILGHLRKVEETWKAPIKRMASKCHELTDDDQ